MVFCRGCGKEIHETAPTCPHCGAVQRLSDAHTDDGTIWVPTISLVLGVASFLAACSDGRWDEDTMWGLAFFSCGGLLFGALSLAKQKTGRGVAIGGVVLSSLALLALLGHGK